MPQDILGVAMIGNPHRSIVAEDNPHGRYVAGCDVNPAVCAEAHERHHVPTFRDFREMLAQPGIDVVVIRTPNYVHFEPVMAALEAGKHVFSEKPMALTMDHCRGMTAAARQHRRLLQVNLELRSSVLPVRMKEIAESGELGALRRILFHHYQGAWDHDPDHWRMSLEKSGGIFPEKLVHEVDVFRWLAGEIRAVQSFAAENVLPQSPFPDCLQSMFWFECGALGSMLHTQTRSAMNVPREDFSAYGHELRFDLIGTKGSLKSDLWAGAVEVYHLCPGTQQGSRVPHFARREDYRGLGIHRLGHNTEAHFQEFLRRILAGEPELQPPEDVLKTMAVTLAAERSVRTGEKQSVETP